MDPPAQLVPPDVTLRVHVLGTFELYQGGRRIADSEWRHRSKALLLFKRLVTSPRRRVATDSITEEFWPESSWNQAYNNLRALVSQMRDVLESPRLPRSHSIIESNREAVSFRSDVDIWIDAEAFEQAAAKARHKNTDPLPLLEEADSLYRGDLLPDEEWAAEQRRALNRTWVELKLSLAKVREQRGETAAAISGLQTLLQTDTCNERAAQSLLQLLINDGRRADALRVCDSITAALRDELGMAPSPETLELCRLARANQAIVSLRRTFRPSYPFPTPSTLVGREKEIARLERALARASRAGETVLIQGPAGAGKSALVGTLVARAQASGVLVLVGGCYEQRGALPLGPFHDAITDYLLALPSDQARTEAGQVARDLASVAPELGPHLDLSHEPTQAPGDQTSLRLRQFGAILTLVRTLAAHQPVVLCVEDLHAADIASLQLLHYLARQTRRLPLFLVATMRDDEDSASDGDSLGQAVTGLLRERLADLVHLETFDRLATGHQIGALLNGRPGSELVEWVFAVTEGNPLFVEQLVLAMREAGQVVDAHGLWQRRATAEETLPTFVREVIELRLARLTAGARDVLDLAAVLGQTFDYADLFACLAPGDETQLLEDLGELVDRQLLRSMPNGYAFSHAVTYQTVYQDLNLPRRTLLHARAAEMLEQLAGERALDRAPSLARHYILAGQSPRVRAKAFEYSVAAGARAAAVSSHREAFHHFDRACSLLDSTASRVEESAVLAALEGLGQAQRELAKWADCVETFQRVLQLTPDPLRRARARGVISFALQKLGRTSEALVVADEGLAEIAAAPESPATNMARLRLHLDKVVPWFLQGRFRALLALGQDMLADAQELGRPLLLNWAHITLGVGYGGQGHLDRAIDEQMLALDAAEQGSDKITVAVTRESLGITYLRAGQYDAAEERLKEALALYREFADDQRAVNTLQAMGRLALATGALDQAREFAEVALALATQVQHRVAAECHELLALIHELRCEWSAAEYRHRLALDIRRQAAHVAGQVESLVALGHVEVLQGNWPRARTMFEEALEVAHAMDEAPQLAAAERHLGLLLLRMGLREEGAAGLERAFAIVNRAQTSSEYAPTVLAVAEWQHRGGRDLDSLAQTEAALASARSLSLRVQAHAALVVLKISAGSMGDAVRHGNAALELAEKLASPYLLGVAHLAIARIAHAKSGPAEAEPSFAEAVRQFESAGTPYEAALVRREHGTLLQAIGDHTGRADVILGEAELGLHQLAAAVD
jgi:DNA-binding SARP family transcriptional activator/Tfp pilus assembly protein PilF